MQGITERGPAPLTRTPPLRKRISWTVLLLGMAGACIAFFGLMLKILLSGIKLPV
jgi:hypothetical protein